MRFSFPRVFRVVVAGCAFVAAPAQAAKIAEGPKRDAMVEGAMMCTRHFPRYEREFGIPTHLLSAIASTESGRYHKGLKIRLPWPWTVTSGGAGKYYDTKEEAIAAVKKLKASGVRNIDIGCMQVNLQHHGEHFATIEQAFEPERNITYAATFLRSLYDDEKNWKTAASHYHSRTPSLGTRYIGMVYDSWFNIIQKLREARLAVPASSLSGMNEIKGGTPAPYASAKVEPYPAAAKPAYAPPRMNSITVSHMQPSAGVPDSLSYTREGGARVVRADSRSLASPLVITPATAAAAPAAVAPPPQAPAGTGYAVATLARDPAPLPAPAAVPAAAPVPAAPAVRAAQAPAVTASVSVPLSGVTQAALAPVTGIAGAALHNAATQARDGILPPASEPQTPQSIPLGRLRPVQTSQVSYQSGPNFIFSE